MTEYFDAVARSLYEARAGELTFEVLLQVESKLVRDVSICGQLPGFPQDLRAAIDFLIMSKGVMSRPRVRGFPEGDAEDCEDQLSQLLVLSSDLHSIFHEVAQRGLRGFSDSPLLPLSSMEAEAEERREDDAAAYVLFMKLLPWLQSLETE